MAYTGNWVQNDITEITKQLTDAMDKAFEFEAKTAGMTADPRLVDATSNSKTIKLATPSVEGAGNYSVTKGWPQKKATLTWESYTLTHDRGAAFLIDALENSQSGGLASIATMSAEFMRTQMIPEIDAVRLAKVADTAVTKSQVTESETLSKSDIVTKITDALDDLYERTGIDSGNTIYMNINLRKILNASTEYQKVRDVVGNGTGLLTTTDSINGNPIVWVPAARMHSKVTLNEGDSDAGGFTGAGSPINFEIVAPGHVQGLNSYSSITMLPKGSHTEGDGDFWAYRIYYDCVIPKNKQVGVYASLSATHNEPEGP